MSTTAAKTKETLEAAAFDSSKAVDQFRTLAEGGMEQSRQAYEKIRANAEYTQKSMETTFETARKAGNDMSVKSLSALRANAELGFTHIESLMKVKSFSELVELQGAFIRQSMELAIEQARDFQTASTKATEEVIKPIKDAFEHSVKELEAA